MSAAADVRPALIGHLEDLRLPTVRERYDGTARPTLVGGTKFIAYSTTPEPAMLGLVGSVLVGLGLLARKRVFRWHWGGPLVRGRPPGRLPVVRNGLVLPAKSGSRGTTL